MTSLLIHEHSDTIKNDPKSAEFIDKLLELKPDMSTLSEFDRLFDKILERRNLKIINYILGSETFKIEEYIQSSKERFDNVKRAVDESPQLKKLLQKYHFFEKSV